MTLSAGQIFGIAIGVYFLSALLPSAFDNFFGANTTTWDTATVALWGLIPLGIIALVVYKYVPSTGGKKGT